MVNGRKESNKVEESSYFQQDKIMKENGIQVKCMGKASFIEITERNLKVFGSMANFKNISVDMHTRYYLTIY